MKKVIKISLALVATLLIFLNVTFFLDGNKLEGVSLNANAQTAQADEQCYMHPTNFYCYCLQIGYYCVALCYDHYGYDCHEIIIEGK